MGLVIAFAVAGRLDRLQSWIWRAQVQILYDSRASTWGSPRFFPYAKRFGDAGSDKVHMDIR